MPIYEAECQACNHQFETIANVDEEIECPLCGFSCKRLIGVPGVNIFNNDAAWIKSVTEVVDKEGGAHCQRFLKDPTRENMREWMKKEGIRHYEAGEPIKPSQPDMSRVHREVLDKHRARNRIVVGGL